MDVDVDVIVIGAGPAGCAAAISCIRAGLSVLMITGKINISATNIAVPSESIHPGVLSLLAQINAEEAVAIASEGTYEGVQTGNVFSPLGSSDKGEPWLGHHVNRQKFDNALFDIAVKQGVNIIENDAVANFVLEDGWVIGVTTQTKKNILCKYTIDASGYKRIGGKRLHFSETYYSLPLTAWTGITENIPKEHPLFNNFTQFIPETDGWTWLAPEPPHRCTWTRLSAKGEQPISVPSQLKTFTNTGNIKAANCRWRIFEPVCKEGIVLCGDAAAIIDPAAGQGILMALLSGINAANTVASCINDADREAFFLLAYNDWYQQFYENKAQQLKKYYLDLGILLF